MTRTQPDHVKTSSDASSFKASTNLSATSNDISGLKEDVVVLQDFSQVAYNETRNHDKNINQLEDKVKSSENMTNALDFDATKTQEETNFSESSQSIATQQQLNNTNAEVDAIRSDLTLLEDKHSELKTTVEELQRWTNNHGSEMMTRVEALESFAKNHADLMQSLQGEVKQTRQEQSHLQMKKEKLQLEKENEELRRSTLDLSNELALMNDKLNINDETDSESTDKDMAGLDANAKKQAKEVDKQTEKAEKLASDSKAAQQAAKEKAKAEVMEKEKQEAAEKKRGDDNAKKNAKLVLRNVNRDVWEDRY